MQQLIDLGTDSPRAMSPERMSNECAKLILVDLMQGDFNVTTWQNDFIHDVFFNDMFTLDQKKVIYNLAHKFRIL